MPHSIICSVQDTCPCIPAFFFFNDTATTEIYTLSLHDALPISFPDVAIGPDFRFGMPFFLPIAYYDTRVQLLDNISLARGDRKSTRLNSSHDQISYAVFCLKKKNQMLLRSSSAVGSTNDHVNIL